MVVLTPRFTLLTVSCTLAAISLSPLSASAVAIQARDSGSSSNSAVTSRDPILQRAPVLPIPSTAAQRSAAGEQHEERTYHNQVYFGDRSTSEKRDSHSPASPHHQRRSSIIVAGQHGEPYIVSQTSRAPIVHKRFDSMVGDQAYLESETDQDEVPGRVDIMSPAADPQQFKKLGSLWVDPETLIFASSENNVTEIRLVTVPGATASNSNIRVVKMKVMMFNASSTDLQSFCATTHTQGGSSDMTAERCDPQIVTPSHNQLFNYNVDSGVVNPTQVAGQDDGKKEDLSSSSSNSTDPTVASVFGERDVGGPGNAQNVELVFVSKAPAVANVEDSPESTQMTVVTATTTMTSTFTYTTSMIASVSAADVVPASAVTSSDSAAVPTSSSLVSTSVPVSAADASPTSAMVSSSSSVAATSTSAMSATAIGSTSSVDASSSSIVTPTDTLSAADARSTSLVVSSSSATSSATTSSVPSLDALNVQVVAPVSASVTSTTVTSTSAAPTSSINADALASSIAASFASSRATAASSIVTSATTVATAAAMDASSGVASSSQAVSSSMPSVTPVSTDPYTFIFKSGNE